MNMTATASPTPEWMQHVSSPAPRLRRQRPLGLRGALNRARLFAWAWKRQMTFVPTIRRVGGPWGTSHAWSHGDPLDT